MNIKAQTYLNPDPKQPANDLLTYWKNRLTGIPPSMELPTDFLRMSTSGYSESGLTFSMPNLLSEKLMELSRAIDTTIPVIVLAAYQTLLFRYTNQEDILVACTSCDSTVYVDHAGTTMGHQTSTIPLRISVTGDPDFLQLVRRVSDAIIEAEAQEKISFDNLLHSLHHDGIPIHSLQQVGFEFVDYIKGQPDLSSSTQSPILQADLNLSIVRDDQGLSGQWKFNKHLFLAESIERISNHFQQLLLSIVTDPSRPVSKSQLLSTQERLQILFDWNQTAISYPEDKCIHQLFEEQVLKTPNAIALELYKQNDSTSLSAQTTLTYDELNSRANRLAYDLREVGVGPDVLVGICVNRSFEMLVGILAILKAGGAYVPLDPSYPTERLHFMLNDSGVSILLTQHHLKDRFRINEVSILCLDTNRNQVAVHSDQNPTVITTPTNLAYVIYTSGSTGVPKGTLIVHRGVVNYLSWCIKEYQVEDGSGAPVNSSIAFDATVTSLFAPLLVGKRVLLLPELDEIEALGDVLGSRKNFSLIKITPAHLHVLLHSLQLENLKDQANVIVIGGEALHREAVDSWLRHAPATRLINEYGPTETVVGCCIYEVTNNDVGDNVPIGRPIANIQLYILDRHMEPVPIGVTGEIYIGGAGVARGYLNRPDLTDLRFIRNPFSDDPNSRLYKTGDSARYLADGNIVFLGRMDQQVKIRGYRIELAEIESVLLKHRSVEEVAVLSHQDSTGDKRLAAYIVPKTQNCTGNEFREFLNAKVPAYMVPADIVLLESLPLTVNGKLDRAALEQLPAPSQKIKKSITLPRNTVELRLVKILQKALNLPEVGVTDDFFEIGGNSVRAAEVFGQINKSFHKRLPLSTLINAPTIEKIALVISTSENSVTSSCLVPIQPTGSKPPLFCIHGGWGNVLFYTFLAKQLGNDQPLYAIQARGLTGKEEPFSKLEDMAAHYIHEIKSVQPNGPYHLAGYCFGAIAAFEIAQQLLRSGEEVAFLGSFNGIAPTYYQPGKENTVRTVKKMTPKKKLKFLKKIIRVKIDVLKFKASLKIRALCYGFYRNQRRPLPDTLQRYFIGDSISIAQDNYRPQPYPGQLVIFRSPGIFRNPELGWSKLILGGITTIDIPGEHRNRTRIMYEPFVQCLAAELKKQLEISRGGER